MSAEHFVKDRAQAEDVCASIQFLTTRLFGGHVLGGSNDHAEGGLCIDRRPFARRTRIVRALTHEARNSKVHNLHQPVGADDDVLRLDVAMDQAGAVGHRKT